MSRVRELWILRHAEAESTGPEGDASRVLTGDGRRRAKEVGRSLADRGLRAARVVTSPYLRARETAGLAAAEAAPGIGIARPSRAIIVLRPAGLTNTRAYLSACGPLPFLPISSGLTLRHRRASAQGIR